MSYIPLHIQNKIESAKLEKLKELDLSYQATSFKLKEIPPQVFDLTHLEGLNLRDNDIEEIPLEILRLRNLKSLNLIDNKLKAIPDRLSELPSLKSLSLTYRSEE